MADDDQMVGDEEVPRSRLSKMALLIIAFSAVLGVLFAAVLGGGVYFAKKTNALQAELSSVKKELKGLKAQTPGVEELQTQITALLLAVDALKTQAKAAPEPELGKASATAGEPKEAGGKTPSQHRDAKEKHGGNAMAKPEPAATSAEAPKPKSAPSDAFSCNLSGKSPEEQAAVLKRCVTVMDTPPAASKPRAP